jgi:DNA polymerase III subunit delta
MIFKSYIIEQKFQSINNCKLFLFYGENQGLKKEFKEKLKIENKDQEILNLFQDEIIKNKNILVNEINNKSLFNEKKIIFINEVSDKILDIIDEIINNIQDEKIFLFSNILDKKSKLRSYFEKSKFCGIAPCYQDNEITIRKIIMKKLNGYQGLTGQIINFIIQNTGLDRNKVNNEIDKIISCFKDKKIDPSKIDLLLNIRTSDDFNLLKDEALNGNKNNTNRLLADTVFEVENNIYYLNSINQRINRLNEIENMKQENSDIESLISNLKPPVFWKDKPILIEQSRKWNKNKIQTALKKTYNAEIEIKSNSSIRKDLLIKNLIIELCATASSA